MNINDDIDRKMILKFLNTFYCVTRVKKNKKFRRAIIFESRPYFFCDKGDINILMSKLKHIIQMVFHVDHKLIDGVLSQFLRF